MSNYYAKQNWTLLGKKEPENWTEGYRLWVRKDPSNGQVEISKEPIPYHCDDEYMYLTKEEAENVLRFIADNSTEDGVPDEG